MAIDPLARSTTPPRPEQLRPDTAAVAAPAAAANSATEAPQTVLAADQLAISHDALIASRAEGVPSGAVTASQMADISQKLADGAYDSPEVQLVLSELVLRQIQLPVGWGGLA